MPLEDLQREVAAVVLRAAGRYGFALAGGCALIAHGVVSRDTEDVDLFTDDEGGVQAAASSVEASLRAAGMTAVRRDKTAGLADIFPGMGEGLAEWVITGPAGEQMLLQMSYFERGRQPVIMDIGPVLDLEDVLAGKAMALASRYAERDYVDLAAAMERGYSAAQLIGLARKLDPGLEDLDFAEAGDRLDNMDGEALARYGLDQQDVTRLRRQFAAWPRSRAHLRSSSS